MGKTKSKMIRRAAKNLLENGVEFTDNFESNKKILGDTMPSRKIRNQMAGFLVREKKNKITETAKLGNDRRTK